MNQVQLLVTNILACRNLNELQAVMDE